MSAANVRKGLGKGLGAIFNETEPSSELIHNIDFFKLEPNLAQPRKAFDQASLEELSKSIAQYGILQPLIVAKLSDDSFQIIAGERRFRASRLLKLETLPCIIREFDELNTLQVSLVENLQRKDLNPIEEATSYKRLIDEFSLTQDDVAEKVNKSRSTIANCLRLINLDKRVQGLISDGRLSSGHGKVLLAFPAGEQFEAAELSIENELSVRQLEELLAKKNITKNKKKLIKKPTVLRSAEEDLTSHLGTKVKITPGKKKGKIEIEFYSDDDLDRLLLIIKN